MLKHYKESVILKLRLFLLECFNKLHLYVKLKKKIKT